MGWGFMAAPWELAGCDKERANVTSLRNTCKPRKYEKYMSSGSGAGLSAGMTLSYQLTVAFT